MTMIKSGTTRMLDFGSQVKVIEGDRFDGDFLPKGMVQGLTVREIRAKVAKMVADEAEFFRRGEELKAAFPGVTFGYIGNLETQWDDRGYSIYLPHPGRIGTYQDRIGLWRRWELDEALSEWDQIVESVRKGMEGRQ